MKELLATKKVQKDEYLCAVAFGPGLTMEIVFLKGV
jgi:predicted naringenin-chalcone synthase